MKDAIIALSQEQLAQLSIDLQVQLEHGTATRPVLWLLKGARDRAAQAMRDLIDIKATDAVGIVLLQNTVQQYSDMVEDCRQLLARGKEADREIDENVRTEIADVLDIDEARELGLTKTPEDM